ncbi:MAG: hypothetical protein RRB13_11970 [bacterium]|nr:hypothetical protein [bacterium]
MLIAAEAYGLSVHCRRFEVPPSMLAQWSALCGEQPAPERPGNQPKADVSPDLKSCTYCTLSHGWGTVTADLNFKLYRASAWAHLPPVQLKRSSAPAPLAGSRGPPNTFPLLWA